MGSDPDNHVLTLEALPYRWHWRKYLPERHGQLFRVVVWGMADRAEPAAFPIPLQLIGAPPKPMRNACIVEFSDGWRCVTSRNALRRLGPRPVRPRRGR